MYLLKVTPVLLLVLVVGAEKKIELQDIEEDNLKSENQKDSDERPEARSQNDEDPGSLPLQYIKNEFLRYFEGPSQAQQQRYVQQYAVSEAPEHRSSPVTPSPVYGPPTAAQQAMVGYLSNVPMQFYLLPQYYSQPAEQTSPHAEQYQADSNSHSYQTPEPSQSHDNYAEGPSYVAPSGKTYVQQYTQPVTYVSYPQPTITPVHATVAPVLYQMPVVQYPTAIFSQQPAKSYYSQYTEPNTVEEVHDNDIESQKQYSTQPEEPAPEIPRHYYSRAPVRDGYRSGPSELPHPSPLLLKPAPPHLSHLPKALPIYRPQTKPVYHSNIVQAPSVYHDNSNIIQSSFTPKPLEPYGPKRRPTSLLDSYIPSSVQVEYLKRGFAKDPLVLYETLSSGRHYPSPPIIPKHYERGFLPNQMYHTASGGITYGHRKRSSKGEKVPQK